MFAAQTFAGDRADGTERFLLERPVSRRKTWLARSLASLLSIVIVLVGNTLYMLALFALIDDGTAAAGYRIIVLAGLIGLGLSVLGTIGGMAAGEMVRTPIQAVLVGAVLTALPLSFAVFMASAFDLVRAYGVHLAFVVAPILPLALILVSYRAGCHGEPSGRGRIVRGASVLGVALLIAPVLFAAAAPLVLRAGVSGGWVSAVARTDNQALLLGGGRLERRGWMLDGTEKRKTRFLPPPIDSSAWKPDGSRLAVVHHWGLMGSRGSRTLEVIDAAGDTLHSIDIDFGDGAVANGLTWVGDLVLLRDFLSVRRASIRVIEPARGVLGKIELGGLGGQNWGLVGPIDDGSIYVHRLVANEPRSYELVRLDLVGMRLGERVLFEDDDTPTFSARRLSPSGRYWTVSYWNHDAKRQVSWIIDLQTGHRTEYADSKFAGWLTGDRLVRVESIGEAGARLVVQQGDADGELLREFRQRIGVAISPDSERLLVARRNDREQHPIWRSYTGTAITGHSSDRLWVVDDNDWIELDSLLEELPEHRAWIYWGGPSTLVASSGAGNAVADVGPRARWVEVAGRWE
jgi:MFS family permease